MNHGLRTRSSRRAGATGASPRRPAQGVGAEAGQGDGCPQGLPARQGAGKQPLHHPPLSPGLRSISPLGMADLIDKLERTALKHVRAKRYELAGDLEVLVVREPDLRAGYFGILAQRASDGQGPLRPAAGPSAGRGRQCRRRSGGCASRPSSASAAAVHEMPANRGRRRSSPPDEAAQLDLAADPSSSGREIGCGSSPAAG